MNTGNSYTNYNNNKRDLSFVVGNSNTFNISEENCDMKVDVIANKHYGARIWGQIKDDKNNIIKGALVKLVKTYYENNCIEYANVANCISDDEGFYQFEVEFSDDDSAYKIIVSKSLN